MLIYVQAVGLKRRFKHGNHTVRIGVTASKDVERCIPVLRPCVHRDMRFREQSYAGNAERLELVNEQLEKGGSRGARGVDEGSFDEAAIVEAVGTPEVDR